MKRIDLHIHSTLSDGSLPPEEVLATCAEVGLDTIAITDHDLVTSLDPGEHRFGSRTVRFIAGAEISGTHEGRELHLLVYFPGEAPTAFLDLCDGQIRFRAERYDAAIDALGLSGLSGADAAAHGGRRALTRLHLAQAVVEAGHAANVPEAFSRLLGDESGNVRPFDLPFVEAIRLARSLGGITSWAHPNVNHAKAWIDTFAEAGLQGVEVFRPRLPSTERKTLKKLAKRHHLFMTGGSDWHGWYGQELGLFHVTPFEVQGFLEVLQAA